MSPRCYFLALIAFAWAGQSSPIVAADSTAQVTAGPVAADNLDTSAPKAQPTQAVNQMGAVFDPTLDYAPRCEILTDTLKIDSIAATGKIDAATQFAALRDARQNVTRALQQAGSARDVLKSHLDDRRSDRARIETARSVPTAAISSDDLLKNMIDLKSQALSIQRQIDSAKDSQEAEPLKGKLDDIMRKQTQLSVEMDRSEARAREMADAQKRAAAMFSDLKNAIARNENSIQSATTDIECLTALQNKIDGSIYAALVPETQKNEFKLWMSGLFALMVLVVILGFFTVALRDAAIRAAIFSNQTGIQFVTLFSLVIAIILFGITEILQAKELSALLGGISGYILGRVTTDRTSASATAVQGRSQSVGGNSIAFLAPNKIRKDDGGFDNFSVNGHLRITGSAQNDGEYTVTSVSRMELLVAEQTIKNEPTGPTVTVTAV